MKLTAYPFDTTGALLPVYRDAYLRGDLSQAHTRLVDAYLQQNPAVGEQTWQRFHDMQQAGEKVRSVGWMQRQLDLVRTSSQRVRRQAVALVAVAALIGGAVFANNTLPGLPTNEPAEANSPMLMTTVRGKILDENGRPLVGATVLEKGTQRGVSTNAEGEYALLVPAGRLTTLTYGYGGYADDEIQFTGNTTNTVENRTLVPAAKPVRKAKRWFLFN
ncbi:MAG TPA: carboxypeptidase-like regulatory domain-containing protein [Hymenobacter sp.]|jgi:hypothetical protein